MTWDQLLELRDIAAATIEANVARLQPRGGDGVTVNGRTISLEPVRRKRGGDEAAGRRVAVNEPIRQKIWIFGALSWTETGITAEGEPFASEGNTGEMELVSIAHENGVLEAVGRVWQEAFFYKLNAPTGQAFPKGERQIKMRLVARIFRRNEPVVMGGGRFPYAVQLKIDHLADDITAVAKVDLVTVGRRGLVYEPERKAEGHLYRLQLREVRHG